MRSLLGFILSLLLLLAAPSLAAETLLSTGEPVATFVKDKIHAYNFVVFAKSYCPHCRQTKQLLEKSYGQYYSNIVNLNELPSEDGSKIQTHLMELTGQRTVPNVFVLQKQIGGNSEFQQMHASGKIEEMLQSAKDGATGSWASIDEL